MSKCFRIQDELGHYADKFSFAECDGEWWYFSNTGYQWGSILHDSVKTANKLLEYLIHKSMLLGFSKEFRVVEVEECDLDFENQIIRKK